MTPFINLGGYPIRITEDRYPDGTLCVVAEHPHLDGCVAYAPDGPTAVRLLEEARDAYVASLKAHGEPVPAPAMPIGELLSTSFSAGGARRTTTTISGANALQPAYV